MEVNVKVINENGKIPTQATGGAAGWDVYASETCEIPAKGWKKIKLGIALEIPPHLCAILLKRSGMASRGIFGQEGLIDSDYRGEIGVIIRNNQDQRYPIHVGDRVGQLLFVPKVQVQLRKVTTLQPTPRGKGGFGSTGR